MSIRGRLRKIGLNSCIVVLVEAGRVIGEAVLSGEFVLVDHGVHVEAVILPVSEGVNLCVVIFLHDLPLGFILNLDGGEIARINFGGGDQVRNSLDLAFTLSNLLVSLLNLGLDVSVAVLNELALAAVVAKEGTLVGGLELGSGKEQSVVDLGLDELQS